MENLTNKRANRYVYVVHAGNHTYTGNHTDSVLALIRRVCDKGLLTLLVS